MLSDLTSPWPEYAAAFVEIAAPGGRLLLRPRPSVRPDADLSSSWRDLTGALGVPEGTVVWIVTASNPYPVDLDEATNAVRARQLEQELDGRGLHHLEALARSPDGTSQEVSRAVHSTTRAALRDTARHFEQLAVFEIAAEIACVETSTGRIVTSRPYSVGLAEV
jgi:hypothetical protein